MNRQPPLKKLLPFLVSLSCDCACLDILVSISLLPKMVSLSERNYCCCKTWSILESYTQLDILTWCVSILHFMFYQGNSIFPSIFSPFLEQPKLPISRVAMHMLQLYKQCFSCREGSRVGGVVQLHPILDWIILQKPPGTF